jgi:hypothetical protein
MEAGGGGLGGEEGGGYGEGGGGGARGAIPGQAASATCAVESSLIA